MRKQPAPAPVSLRRIPCFATTRYGQVGEAEKGLPQTAAKGRGLSCPCQSPRRFQRKCRFHVGDAAGRAVDRIPPQKGDPRERIPQGRIRPRIVSGLPIRAIAIRNYVQKPPIFMHVLPGDCHMPVLRQSGRNPLSSGTINGH
jgi:hypothetical protein